MSEEIKVGDWVRIKEGHYIETLHNQKRQIRRIDGAGDFWVDDVSGGVFGDGGVCVSPEFVERASPPIPNKQHPITSREWRGTEPAYREPKDGKGCQHLLRVGFPHTLNELAKHMECSLGKDRNWEKGLPLSSFANALDRHWSEHLSGNEEDGRALVSVLWNLLCYAETLHRTQLGTLPAELDDIDRSKRSEIVYGTEEVG